MRRVWPIVTIERAWFAKEGGMLCVCQARTILVQLRCRANTWEPVGPPVGRGGGWRDLT